VLDCLPRLSAYADICGAGVDAVKIAVQSQCSQQARPAYRLA
jgi:hypothetical protein